MAPAPRRGESAPGSPGQADRLIAAAVMIGQSELRQSIFVDISLFQACAMELRPVARLATCSKRLVVVGDQRAHDGLAAVVVVPDGCSQGEDALQDTGEYAGRGVPAVAFQVTLPLNMSLTDSMIWRSGLKNCLPRRSGSPLRGGAEQDEPGCGEGGPEVVPVVVLAGDDDQPACCARTRALMSRACQRRD